MFCWVLILKIIVTFFCQDDIRKFREMNLQNFEIEKIDVFSIGYSKKSFRYIIYYSLKVKTYSSCQNYKIMSFVKPDGQSKRK